MEYANVICDIHVNTANDIHNMEMVQHREVRFETGEFHSISALTPYYNSKELRLLD